MNSLWHAVKQLYVLGLIPAVLLFAISVANFGHNNDVGVPLMMLTGLYIFASWPILVLFPNMLSDRLKWHVRKHIEKGFSPRWELESVSARKYLGFDSVRRRVLFLDVSSGVSENFSFDDLCAWEMETFRSRPAILRILTSLQSRSVITLSFEACHANIWRAYLEQIFASGSNEQLWG